jgi:ferrous-iron efflux pump FieF
MLLITAFFMGETLRRGNADVPLLRPGLGLAVILLSTLVNSFLIWKLKQAERATGSLIMHTESVHYLIDLLSYGVILISLILVSMTGWPFFDLLGGLIVAAYVAFLSFKILIRAANELVDRALPQVVLDELDRIIRRHDESIANYHDLRTRRMGNRNFIDFHLEFRGGQNFEKAHEITEGLIVKIQERFPNADVTIHEDPEGAT